MNQGRLTGLLLSPSLFSVSVAALLSLAILGIANWSYITPDNPLYGYLFGEYGLTTLLEKAPNSLSAINGAFDNPSAYRVAVLIVAVFTGLLVYVFLEGANHVAAKAKDEVNEVAYVSDATVKRTIRKEMEVRVGLRLAALVAWICYIIFFARVIVPYCILLGRIDTAHLWTWNNAAHGFGAFALLLFAFHVHAILMRLLVLRPRFFGGQ